MDISIIIGLLIALVIVCATMMKVSALKRENKLLKKRWNNRTLVIEDIIFYVFRFNDFTNRLNKLELSNEDKGTLFYLKNSINNIINSIRDYERKSF